MNNRIGGSKRSKKDQRHPERLLPQPETPYQNYTEIKNKLMKVEKQKITNKTLLRN